MALDAIIGEGSGGNLHRRRTRADSRLQGTCGLRVHANPHPRLDFQIAFPNIHSSVSIYSGVNLPFIK